MSTVTYAYPVAGTVPPTAAQAFYANMLTAQINTSDADTTAVITHNWGLTTAQLNNLWPTIQLYLNTNGGTALPIITWALTNSVSVTMTKVSASGSGGTYTVVMLRPLSQIT